MRFDTCTPPFLPSQAQSRRTRRRSHRLRTPPLSSNSTSATSSVRRGTSSRKSGESDTSNPTPPTALLLNSPYPSALHPSPYPPALLPLTAALLPPTPLPLSLCPAPLPLPPCPTPQPYFPLHPSPYPPVLRPCPTSPYAPTPTPLPYAAALLRSVVGRLLSWGGKRIDPVGVDYILQKLGFEHARLTIPKWLQRGCMDPLDSILSILVHQLVIALRGGEETTPHEDDHSAVSTPVG